MGHPGQRPPEATRSSEPASGGDLVGDGRSELLQDLLVKTSRTFALAIPVLPEPTLRQVTLAYLLFRIADTFEDATVAWSRAQRLEALSELAHLLRDVSVAGAERLAVGALAQPPSRHGGYLELLQKTPEVIGAFLDLGPAARRIISRHTLRTTLGMSRFVRRAGDDGVLRLRDLGDLRSYCYVVAGIVGEMLTELFILGGDRLESESSYLNRRAARFGEGLQLVNILKDSSTDAVEGRNYVPPVVDRGEVFALARRDLDAAAEYCLAIQRAGGHEGVLKFTSLPVALAWATLDRVEERGPGSKITRPEVYMIRRRLYRAIAAGQPVLTPRGS